MVKEAYMMGADEGYVFSDRRLGGADVLATSYTLSQAIQSVGDFDLILCGKQTTDGRYRSGWPCHRRALGSPMPRGFPSSPSAATAWMLSSSCRM